MSMTIAPAITGGGTHTLTAAQDNCFVPVDCTAGNTTLLLDPALPVGWHIPMLAKTDPGSGVVEIRPQGSDRLNHFWTANNPFGLYLNLTQQCGELIKIGEHDFFLAKKSEQRAIPQSQRTIITSSYNVLPKDDNEILRCNTQVAGGGIGLYFNPVSHFLPPSPLTGGNYLSRVIEVQKVDPGASGVTILPFAGDALNGVTNATFTLTRHLECVKVYIAGDGLWIQRDYKP